MARARFASSSSLHLVPGQSAPRELVAPDAATAARLVEHSLLKPDATRAEIERACDQAAQYGFAAVSVNAAHVSLAASRLRGSGVKVVAVVGFPLGATLTNVKRFEASEALRLGAREIAMVMNLGALKSGDADFVRSDVRGVADIVHTVGGRLTVILETPLLAHEQKALAAELAIAGGADSVQTSTGTTGSAASSDVALLRHVIGTRAGIAADGVTDAEQFADQVRAGATRVVTSQAATIIAALAQKPKAAASAE